MTRLRVVVVDDSAVLRRLLVEVLEADPEIQVVGEAADGDTGVRRILELRPDAVTLDVDMPGKDGLAVLQDLRGHNVRLPVIMYSRLTERGTRTTLEALCLGASDYVPKPAPGLGLEDARRHIREELIPRLKAVGPLGWRTVPLPDNPGSPPLPRTGLPRDRPEAILVGASTGGPNALVTLFQGLGPGFPVPVLIAQHMPPLFTGLLAERLSAETGARVREAADGDVPRPGEALLAPGNRHLLVEKRGAAARVRLSDDPPENSCRPSVDVLFRSAGAVWGGRVIAVVLTGMGQDGLKGTRLLREKGAHVLAQDEATSVVWGMPGAVARAGLADGLWPIGDLAREIRRRTGVAVRPS